MFKNNKILVFDFETSGLNPNQSQIIEIGAQLYLKENNEHVLSKELNLLVKCQEPLTDNIVKITNITDEKLAESGVTEERAFYELSSLIDDETLLVGYNVAFDLGFLLDIYQKYEDSNFEITNDILDVMAVYKDRHDYPHRLENLVEKYDVEVKNTHRALDDVKATFEGLIKMNQELANIDLYVNKLGCHYRYRYSGIRLKHVEIIPQRGGCNEIHRGAL